MGFKYTTEKKDGFLQVVCQGEPTSPEEFLEYIRSSIVEAQSNNLSRILFNESAATLHFKVYDAVLMSDVLDKEGLQTLGIRAAVVCNGHDMSICKYFETSLRNRAFNVMMYEDEQKGMEWLMRGAIPPDEID